MQLSLFSISYAGLWGQARLELPSFIAKAAELGYSSVMLAGKRPHLSPLDASDEQLAALRATLAEHRVACGAVAAYVDLAPAAAAEVPYVEMQIGYVESLARIAAALGGQYVRIFTAYEMPGQSPHAQWTLVVRSLQEMCDRAAAYGVTLAVQNHHDLAVHTAALLELLAEAARTANLASMPGRRFCGARTSTRPPARPPHLR
jgi:sugar phosphate isomerase/epimerase